MKHLPMLTKNDALGLALVCCCCNFGAFAITTYMLRYPGVVENGFLASNVLKAGLWWAMPLLLAPFYVLVVSGFVFIQRILSKAARMHPTLSPCIMYVGCSAAIAIFMVDLLHDLVVLTAVV